MRTTTSLSLTSWSSLSSIAPIAVRMAERTHCCVRTRVENVTGIARPRERVVDTINNVRKVRAGGEVAEPQDVQLTAAEVDAVRKNSVIGAYLGIAEVKVCVAVSDSILVEQDLFVAAGLPATAMDRILAALDRTRVVDEWTMTDGRARVALLDARHDLCVDTLAERAEVRERVFSPRVLCLEMGDDSGIVRITEPRVLVDAIVAVGPVHDSMPSRDRRFIRGGVLHVKDLEQ